MSFILDALKKSETDRQRQNGPALFEVRVAPPKTGLPLWAIGLGVLLAVNLVIVAWVLLRRSSTPDAAATPPAGTAQMQAANAGRASGGPQYPGQQGYGAPQGYPQAQGEGGQNGYAGAGQQGYAGGQAQGGYPPPQGYPGGQQNYGGQGSAGQGQQGYPGGQQGYGGQGPAGQGQQGYPGGQQSYGGQGPAGQGQQYAAAGYTGQPPYGGPNGAENGYSQGGRPPGAAGQVPGQEGARGAPGAANGGEAQADAGGERLNPDDYAPAADAGPAPAFKQGVTRGTASGVPLYRDAAALPGVNIPQLRLDLHVFAAKPQERFIMINMHKLHEGDTTPDGVHVEYITPEGAVLSKDGVKFLLSRD
jgi:hypothetical protein